MLSAIKIEKTGIRILVLVNSLTYLFEEEQLAGAVTEKGLLQLEEQSHFADQGS